MVTNLLSPWAPLTLLQTSSILAIACKYRLSANTDRYNDENYHNDNANDDDDDAGDDDGDGSNLATSGQKWSGQQGLKNGYDKKSAPREKLFMLHYVTGHSTHDPIFPF